MTNTVTGKKYVGQTRGKLAARLACHKWRARKDPNFYFLSDAIRKYGFAAFIAEVLQECTSRSELDAAEIAWIDKLRTTIPYGYNVRGGGSHGRVHERSKQMMRGRAFTLEHRAKLSKAMRGRKLSPERRAMAVAALRKARMAPRPRQDGEHNGRAKLTEAQVEEIRRLCREGHLSQEKIGALFGVRQTTISYIKIGRNWPTTLRRATT